MVVQTCRIGGTVRIGEDIHVTLQRRLNDRVTVGVIAPAGTRLRFDSACLQPIVLPSGAHAYLFSLLRVRRFRIDEIEIEVWLPGDAVPLAFDCEDYIHFGIRTPQPLRITYEEENERPARIAPRPQASPVQLRN
ncbi:MAG: hypothetical protein KF800_19670 [Lysobacter sp.]|nr:hypothetical protein [Lysobacter sp.]